MPGRPNQPPSRPRPSVQNTPAGARRRSRQETTVSQRKLRVGVVGAGRWAIRSHIPGWQRDPRVEVVALADTNAEALASAGEEFGVVRLESDYRQLTNDPDIDVIDVVTGDRAHFEV